jgi:hypothetical protein
VLALALGGSEKERDFDGVFAEAVPEEDGAYVVSIAVFLSILTRRTAHILAAVGMNGRWYEPAPCSSQIDFWSNGCVLCYRPAARQQYMQSIVHEK